MGRVGMRRRRGWSDGGAAGGLGSGRETGKGRWRWGMRGGVEGRRMEMRNDVEERRGEVGLGWWMGSSTRLFCCNPNSNGSVF